jgi:hypothetical protein
MNRIGFTLVTLLVANACTGGVNDPSSGDDGTTLPPGSTTGGSDTTFDHDNDQISPWDLLNRLEQEGPPEYTSHVHSCQKVRYRNLSGVLASIGVDLTKTTAPAGSAAPTAGYLYASGSAALGNENYANRIRESISITVSGASREFDIFAAAAPEVMAAMGNGSGAGSAALASTLASCGGGVQLFDDSGNCVPSGVSCLLGYPASAAHLSLCNLTVSNASTKDVGEQLAVSAILAAAYTCE